MSSQSRGIVLDDQGGLKLLLYVDNTEWFDLNEESKETG